MNSVLLYMLYMGKSTFKLLFYLTCPHTHIYITLPWMTKKELGVRNCNYAESNVSVLVKIDKMSSIQRQAQSCNADNGKSSHMTSLPQHELSEGFENVNFLKKKMMKKKLIKYIKRKTTFFTGHRKLQDNFCVLRTL